MVFFELRIEAIYFNKLHNAWIVSFEVLTIGSAHDIFISYRKQDVKYLHRKMNSDLDHLDIITLVTQVISNFKCMWKWKKITTGHF